MGKPVAYNSYFTKVRSVVGVLPISFKDRSTPGLFIFFPKFFWRLANFMTAAVWSGVRFWFVGDDCWTVCAATRTVKRRRKSEATERLMVHGSVV